MIHISRVLNTATAEKQQTDVNSDSWLLSWKSHSSWNSCHLKKLLYHHHVGQKDENDESWKPKHAVAAANSREVLSIAFLLAFGTGNRTLLQPHRRSKSCTTCIHLGSWIGCVPVITHYAGFIFCNVNRQTSVAESCTGPHIPALNVCNAIHRLWIFPPVFLTWLHWPRYTSYDVIYLYPCHTGHPTVEPALIPALDICAAVINVASPVFLIT